ncbi:unnamed protein product [Miscanthus lutarioriparius]|uniref:Uncharacterized protein n=1 Tax=Miscanthus lutarioriparius TaxID=422564 RepID=A0A811QBF0_9POAL|nr:unnamed protein product [Miscanthus lutarioriparius]
MEMKKVSDEIKGKQQQIAHLERQIKGKLDQLEHTPAHTKLLEQVNEKALELEVKTADNRVLQDQLQQKTTECQALQEAVAHLHEQLSQALEANDLLSESIIFQQYTDISLQNGSQVHKENPASIDVSDELHQKAEQSDIDELKQRLCELTEAKAQLEAHNQKLQEESMRGTEMGRSPNSQREARERAGFSKKFNTTIEQIAEAYLEQRAGRSNQLASPGSRGLRQDAVAWGVRTAGKSQGPGESAPLEEVTSKTAGGDGASPSSSAPGRGSRRGRRRATFTAVTDCEFSGKP